MVQSATLSEPTNSAPSPSPPTAQTHHYWLGVFKALHQRSSLAVRTILYDKGALHLQAPVRRAEPMRLSQHGTTFGDVVC
jgi:hypothetical protein